MRAAICPLFVAILAAWAQPGGQGVISGTVIDGSSGDPVRKAIVTVTWDGTPGSWATVQTNGNGEFRVEGLPPGKYSVRANKLLLGSGAYGAANTRELGGSIQLADGETRQGLSIRLFRSASITGHVFDPDGDPVANTQISLLIISRSLGERVLVGRGISQTDDKGEYRISNVQPGRYYLQATPQNQNFPAIHGTEQKWLVPEFYGGVRDSKDASLLAIRGGDALTGIDFRLTAEPLGEVHGHFTAVPDSPHDPVVGIPVSLSPESDGPAPGWNRGEGTTEPGHRFRFENVPIGRYRIEGQFRAANKMYFASQSIDVQPGMGDIEVAFAPAVSLKGQLRPRRNNSGAQPNKDGQFTLHQIPPDDDWEININPLPPGAYLKSAKLGDQDVRFKRFRTPSGPDANLAIVISMNTARIEGEIDAADKGKAGILLVPTGQFHNLARFYYSVDSDDDGKFKIMGIAPGKYKIFGLEKTSAALFRDPDIADKLGETGEEIELAEGTVFQAHPKLVPLEKIREVLP